MVNDKNLAIVGVQWGDEGKGKIVDILSDGFDVVARYQGGHNAGHTIRIGDRQFVLHLIPSGIFHAGMQCIVGSGVVVDPQALFQECDTLMDAGIEIDGRLFVSNRCHLILPYHRILEAALEQQLGDRRIGTTARGIGPAYEDKMARRGLRVCDLINPDGVADRIREQVSQKNQVLEVLNYPERIDAEPICDAYARYAERMRPLAVDTSLLLNQMLKSGKRVLFEGAQATLLDVDHGTFPFVTSSNASAGGIPSGLGIAPKYIHSVLGVMKAYATRVGGGPFPTEANGTRGEQLRLRGVEYGATTGRPRRCGWFDGAAARYAVMINDMDSIAVTKIDVLDGFEEIPVCVGYNYKGTPIDEFPADAGLLGQVRPVYKELHGWDRPIKGVREWTDLPERCRDYLKFLSDFLERPISLVSTGPEREETIKVPTSR